MMAGRGESVKSVGDNDKSVAVYSGRDIMDIWDIMDIILADMLDGDFESWGIRDLSN